MYYGDADAGFGLSDLGVAEMGQLGIGTHDPAAEAKVGFGPAPGWFSPGSFQQIGAGIEKTGQTIAEVLRQKALVQEDIAARRQAARIPSTPPHFDYGRPSSNKWAMPVIIGGLALGGLALFLFMRKKNGSAANNPPRDREDWDDLED